MKNRLFFLVYTSILFTINFSEAQSCYTISGPSDVLSPGNFGKNAVIGDINNDGVNDFLVPMEGTFDGDSNTLNPDEIYVLLGPLDNTSDFDILNEFDFIISFQQEYESFNNYQIMDFNNDEINDLFINTDGRGYLFYGPINGAQNNTDIDVLFITDVTSSLTALGDVTGNGEIDFAVSKNNETTTNQFAGKVRIYEGPFNQPSNELLFNNYSSYEGEDEGDYFGLKVSSVPDMNGDGLNELYISSWEYGICTLIDPASNLCLQFENRDSGDAYIYYSPLLPGDFMANTSNLKFTGPPNQSEFVHRFGQSFSYGNDFNGDGNPDIAFGTRTNNRAYVFNGPFTNSVYSTTDASYVQGGVGTLDTSLPIEGLGFAVMGVNDTNGDGFDELIVGAPNYGTGSTTNRDKGRVYQFNGPINSGTPSSSAIILNEGNHWDLKVGSDFLKGDLNNDQIEDIVHTTDSYFDFQGTIGVCLLDGEILSIKDFNEINNIVVYPNPSDQFLNISSNLEIETVSLFDINRALLKTYNNFSKINISAFASGIYFLEIRSNDNNVITKKVLIK